MKKIIKNILLTVMIIVSMIIFPNMVDAATFKDGNRTYTIEELLIDCPSGIDYSHIDEKNNFLFSNREADDNYHKLNDKGVCVTLSTQDLLDVYNYNNFYVIEYKQDKYYIVNKIYNSFTIALYEKTKDDKVVDGKQYYEIYSSDSMGSVLNPVDEEIENYYEEIILMKPRKAEIEDKTYYVEEGAFKAVSVPKEDVKLEDILNYWVPYDGIEDKTEIVIELSDKFKDILGNTIFFVIKSPVSDDFYIFVLEGEDNFGNVYDTDGNIVFEDVNNMLIVDSLFVVEKNNKAYFYNFDKELVYEIENVSIRDSKLDNEVSSIVARKTDESKNYVLYKLSYEKTNSNPDTGDNILSIIILGGLSLIILTGALIYFKKIKTITK